MKKLTFLKTALLVLLITIPGLCWGAGNALIVHDGTPGIEADALGNLTAHLTKAGYTVSTSVGVPGGSLSGYKQIWDIRFNDTTPLTASDITAYVTYMAGGGSLFVIGENTGFATRNNSIVSLISSAGGGTITIMTPADTETVQSPFTGPTALTTVTFLAAAGTPASGIGTGTFITKDADGIGAAIVFSPGSLANAPAGTLIVVFDVNYLQTDADANSQALTDNMIAYPFLTDILWRHAATGQVYIWLMNGATKRIEGSPGTLSDLNWEIKGRGDFNGDGNADILWRNKVTGQVFIWLMNGTTPISEGSPGTLSDLNWEIKGVGDFNADGNADILWRNKVTGQVFIWLMNGTTPISEDSAGTLSDLNWEIKGVGDFNADGNADILWRNKVTGQVFIWLMNGTTPISEDSPGTLSDLNWEIKGVGDFNADGNADILWRNKVTGQVFIWLMNGATPISEASPGTVRDLNWEIKILRDFNGDGKADILWRHAVSGQVYIWLMNGTTIASQGSPGTVADSNWTIGLDQ